MLVTMGGNALTLALTVFTGVLTARLLNPDGRGEVAAVVSWATTLALLASLGSKEAVTYLQSKEGAPARSILTTSVLYVGLLSLAGVALAELLVPVGFASQRAEVLDLARLYLLMTLPIMTWEGLIGVMNGHQFFVAASVARVGQLLMFAGGLFVLWQVDRVTVAWVLFAHAASHTAMAAILLVFLATRVGFGPFSPGLARQLLSYGLKLHLGTLGSIGNARLDVVVMPAILAPGEIGLYAVAVSGASVLIPLFGELRAVVFPVAARRGGEHGMPLVETTLRFTMAGSCIVAVLLAVAAPLMVRVLYGRDFLGAVAALRILLPGLVLWAGASILAGGVNAAGRPTRTSLAQLAGLVVTVVGLLVTLPTLGIEGAALTSTVAYGTVFGVLLAFLRRQPGFSVARALSPRRLVQDAAAVLARGRAAAMSAAPGADVVRPLPGHERDAAAVDAAARPTSPRPE